MAPPARISVPPETVRARLLLFAPAPPRTPENVLAPLPFRVRVETAELPPTTALAAPEPEVARPATVWFVALVPLPSCRMPLFAPLPSVTLPVDDKVLLALARTNVPCCTLVPPE